MIAILIGAVLTALFCWLIYFGTNYIMIPPLMLTGDQVFPQLYGLQHEKIIFQTSDGLALKGWFIASPDGSEKTILMCHGWGDNKGHLLEMTHFLNSKGGFNLLYFDHRSHGESEGDYTSVGFHERKDAEAAIAWLKKHRPRLAKHMGAFGLSMGGAVVIMTMPSHPEIKAAVIESAFPDYRNVIRRFAWNKYRVPYFPILTLVFIALRWRLGKEVDRSSPIRFIGKIAPRPIFLIGGSEDTLMPEVDIRALFAKAKKPKQLWMVPGAAHAQCHKTAEKEYETRVIEFFRKNIR